MKKPQLLKIQEKLKWIADEIRYSEEEELEGAFYESKIAVDLQKDGSGTVDVVTNHCDKDGSVFESKVANWPFDVLIGGAISMSKNKKLILIQCLKDSISELEKSLAKKK